MSDMFAISTARAQAAPPAATTTTTQTTTTQAPISVEEITVTARQRSETEVTVPISMQVFSAARIKAADITDLNALQSQAGFTFQQGTSTAGAGREFPSLVFRGLQSTYGGGEFNSGSLFVDGIYVSGGQASIDTSDVRQIEVLKGPQSVYFGKNTFGGAVNFITANPSDDFGGSVEASGSVRGSTNFNASVEGPLIPGFLDGRLSVVDYDKAAQYHSGDGGDLGAESTKSITGTLFATPTPKLWFRIRGHYQQDDDSAADVGFIPGSIYGSTCPTGTGSGTTANGTSVPITLASPYFCGSIPSLGATGTKVLDVNTAIPTAFATALATNHFASTPSYDPVLAQVPSLDHSGLRRNILAASGQGSYDLPYNANAAFSIGYNAEQSNDIWDLDRSPNQVYLNAQPVVTSDLTADLRVLSDQTQRIRGLVGITYFHSNYQITQDGDNFYNFPALPYYSGPNFNTSAYQNEDDTIGATYGSLEGDIFSWLTLTAEARYQHDTISDHLLAGGSVSKSFNNILPRFTLKYHPEETWDFYATYSEGVQPATLQTGFLNSTPAQQAYLESKVPGVGDFSPLAHLRNYEIGAKQELFGGRVEYGIAFYRDIWSNQQTSSSIFNPAGCGSIGLTAACPLQFYGTALNLSNNARVQGVEFNTAAQITREWSADLSVDYKEATWLDYTNTTLSTWTGVSHFNGNTLSRVPALSGVLSSTYRDHLFGDWNWYARGQVTYTGSQYESDADVAKVDAYARVNTSLGITKGNLTVELWVKNLFDDKNWDWASRVPELQTANDLFTSYGTYMGVLVQAPDRRDLGLKVSYKF